MLSSRQFTSFPSTLNRAVHFIPTSLAGNFKEFPALAWLLNTCRCLGLCFFLPVPVRTATETAFNLKALWWFHFGGPTQLVFLSIYVFSLQPLMDSGDFHSWLLSDRRLHSESNTMDEVGWCSLSLPASLKWGDLSDWFLCAPDVATWIFSSAICPFNSWSSLTWARSFTSWLAAVLMAATWLWRAAYQMEQLLLQSANFERFRAVSFTILLRGFLLGSGMGSMGVCLYPSASSFSPPLMSAYPQLYG